jgi:hypothetical protein
MAEDFFPPFLSSMQAMIVPHLVDFEHLHDLLADWFIYPRITDKKLHS